MNTLKRSSVAAVVGLAIAASAALAATPTFPAFSGPPSKNNPVAKPNEIVYSGDGSEFFAGAKRPHKALNLHWTVWSSSKGLGTGYQWINNCSPSCANGKFTLYPVTLAVSQPKKESKYFIFTRLKVTYTGKKPRNQKSFTWKISYSHGFFEIG
jgi:hypothetical protein